MLGKRVVTSAFTGVAASNIIDGRTLHGLLRLDVHDYKKRGSKDKKKKRRACCRLLRVSGLGNVEYSKYASYVSSV
jgi:hypothetical protein